MPRFVLNSNRPDAPSATSLDKLRDVARRYFAGRYIPASEYMDLMDAIRVGRVRVVKKKPKPKEEPLQKPEQPFAEFLKEAARVNEQTAQPTREHEARQEGSEGEQERVPEVA